MDVLALHAAERRKDMSENEVFLIFAHLRATEQPRENNRFSVLKTRAADKVIGHSAAREVRHRRDAILASNCSGRSPAPTFLPAAWAIRDVRDAMNRTTVPNNH